MYGLSQTLKWNLSKSHKGIKPLRVQDSNMKQVKLTDMPKPKFIKRSLSESEWYKVCPISLSLLSGTYQSLNGIKQFNI